MYVCVSTVHRWMCVHVCVRMCVPCPWFEVYVCTYYMHARSVIRISSNDEQGDRSVVRLCPDTGADNRQ